MIQYINLARIHCSIQEIIQKPYFGLNMIFQSAGVTLKIRSLKSNRLLTPPNNISMKVSENSPTSSEESVRKWLIYGLYRMVTLKIKSRSPKFNQLFPLSQKLVFNPTNGSEEGVPKRLIFLVFIGQ